MPSRRERTRKSRRVGVNARIRRALAPTRRVRVPVARPREEVFDYLAEPRHRPEWQSSLRRVEVLDDGPPAVGMRWVDHTVLGLSFELAIVDMRRAERWVEEGRSGPFEARVVLTFDPADERAVRGTIVGCEVAVRGRGVARPLGPLATSAGLVAARSDLRRAARILSRA